MIRMISPKALIVSNIAHWLFVAAGMTSAMVLYYTGATIASDGTSSSAVIFAQMRLSPMLICLTAFSSIIASALAGYIAAKLAPHAKFLNGALSTSAWLLFEVYLAISGTTSRGNEVHIPYLLDFLTSYGAVIPALFGAYIWQIRAGTRLSPGQIEATTSTKMPPRRETMTPMGESTPTPARHVTRTGTGLGVFIVIISQFLLTKHEQSILFIGLLTMIALFIAAALAVKVLKNMRPHF